MNIRMSDGGRGTMYFDGECSICVRLARRFEGMLAHRGFRTEPLQGARKLLGLSEDEPLTEMRVRDAGGRVRGGAEAVVFLARHIWWAFPLVLVWSIPVGRSLLALLYRNVAEHRTCQGGVCGLGTPHTVSGHRTPTQRASNKNTGELP